MISILVVNWNTRDLLRACLLSLRENLRDIEHEIIVVDNASHDGSAAMVREEFPEVQLIANGKNEGYARANNQAYGLSSGEWIWLLNSDTEIFPDAAQQLLQSFDQSDLILQKALANASQAESSTRYCEKIGAVASALMDARDGTVQRSCRTFPTPRALWIEATGLQKIFARSRRFGFYRYGDWNMKSAREIEQPMTSSLLVRRNVIESSSGLFDEQFPIFFNDVDLCFRLRQSGWKIMFCPQSRVKHWGGASTNQNKPQMIQESHRAMEAFYRKHWRNEYSMSTWATTIALIRVSGQFRFWRATKKSR
jgi:GT2 family glycosyltransferase